MGGGLQGGGGGGSGSGASNPFAGAGGGFSGASTDLYPSDPNAYDYSGGGAGGAPNAYAYGGQTLADTGGQMGNQDPAMATQQAAQQIQTGSPSPPPDATPTGQQSGSEQQPSLMQDISNVLLGKGASDIVGANQAGATSGGGGPPMPTAPSTQAGPGWLKQDTGQQGPSPTNLTGTNFFNPRPTQTPTAPIAAQATPTVSAQSVQPASAAGATPATPPGAAPGPAGGYGGGETQQQQTAPYDIASAPDASATVSPQSPPASGDKTANATPDATAPAATTPPAAAAPDLMGSSRESGMAPTTPGYYDPRTGGAQGAQQGMGGKGNALGDLLQGNFGRFLGDIFGGGGQPGGQPSYAGSQPPSGPSTADTSPAPTPPPEASQPYRPPPQVANNPSGVPKPGTAQPPQVAYDPTTGQPIEAPAATAQQPGAAATAQPPGTAGAALPPAATAGMTPEMRQAIAKPQANPDGSVTPTNGMPGGLTPNAPPPTQGFGALPNQGNRPPKYGGEITMPDGQKFKYVTGGGQFNSLPYGTYQIHPGAIGNTGRKIGAWAGISDSNNPGNNTVNDPLYRGGGGTHARDGVEIHPDVSGNRHVTNGCIGIDRAQSNAFGQSFRAAAARGPMTLTVRPDGSASISYASPGQMASGNRGPRWGGSLAGPGGTASAGSTTRGDINKNPGNIKMGPDARQFGATGVDSQGHAIFPSVEAGIQAQASLLRRNYNNKTVPEMGRSYAQDRGWAKGVMEAGGFKPNERLNLNDPATMDRLQRAIWKQEGTHPNVASQQTASRGPIRLASSSNEISPDVARMVEQRNQEMESDRRRNATLARRPTIEEGSPSTGSHVPSNRRFHPSDIDEFIQRNAGGLINYIPANRILSILRKAIEPTTVGRDENVR